MRTYTWFEAFIYNFLIKRWVYISQPPFGHWISPISNKKIGHQTANFIISWDTSISSNIRDGKSKAGLRQIEALSNNFK